VDLPEITEVRRLGLRKGDVVVIRVPASLDEDGKKRVSDSAQRAFAGLKPAPRVIVLARDMDIEVIGPEADGP